MHLERILARTRQDLALRKESVKIDELEARAAAHLPRGFAAALRTQATRGPAILAELKKASPSKGLIRPAFDVVELAQGLQRGGAAALSVLTDEPYFQGSLANLEAASRVTSLPCLRKDFIVDEFQIVEARACGADAILLIVAALSEIQLLALNAAAHRYGLDVLCEVHTADELTRALDLECDAIGVNNRDLKSFEVRLEVSLELAGRLPVDVVRVAESGIETAEDIRRLRSAGFEAFLIGESLMRQADPGKALADLLHSVGEVAASRSRAD